MSKDAILRVRETEAAADELRKKAEAEAESRVEACEKENAARLTRLTEQEEATLKAKLESVRTRAGELVAQSSHEADADIQALETAAQEKMKDAVRQIEWEMFDSCL